MDEEDKNVAITVCGDGGCGKSSITLRLVRSAWTSDYDPTIEDSYSVTRSYDGATYHLALTDTAGQEEYRGLFGAATLSAADAFLLVYDITSPRSLEALGHFIQLIDIESDRRADMAGSYSSSWGSSNKKHPVMPIKVVVGNKCDLKEARQISARQGMEWARSKGCMFMETSARDCVNVEETFALLVRRVAQARREHAQAQSSRNKSHHQSFLGLGGSRSESAMGGQMAGTGHTSARTKPLTPLNEKGDPMRAATPSGSQGWSRAALEGGRTPEGGGKGFWSKLKCW